MTAVDDALAACPPDQRSVLQHLREQVHDVPELRELGVIEVRSYNLAAFAVPGPRRPLVVGGFAAGARFLSWYPFSGRTITTLADELAGFETTKGSIHFTVEHPIGDELFRTVLRTRLAEIRTEQR